MRITHVMLSKGVGGAEQILIDVVCGLTELGHEVQVVIDAAFPQKPLLMGLKNVVLSEAKPFSHWDPFAVRHIYHQVKAFAPDIIHCHLSRGALMGGKVACKLATPALVTTHNNIKLKYCQNIAHFQTLTESQCDYLHAEGVSLQRVSKIPNFSNMQPVLSPPQHGARCFVAYGRMVKKKGFEDLISAFKQVLQQRKDAKLILGGDGPERGNLEQLIQRLGLDKQVELSGWVNDVAEFLAQGDFFVLPSRDEPFGIVLLEVMARGLPIISTRTSGGNEVLGDNCAYLANISDPDSLAKAMLAAIDDDGAQLKAEVNLAKFNHYYRKDAVIPQMVSLYQQLSEKFSST